MTITGAANAAGRCRAGRGRGGGPAAAPEGDDGHVGVVIGARKTVVPARRCLACALGVPRGSTG